MVWTTHVDDIFAVFKKTFGDWAFSQTQNRFGKLKRQQLPLTHIGIRYEINKRGLFLHQHDFVRNIEPIRLEAHRSNDLNSALSNQEQHLFRSLLCQLLFATITLVFIHAEVVMLQQYNNNATIQHARIANKLLQKAKTNLQCAGLHFPRLQFPVRLASVADAGHATSTSVYAQEGQIVILMSDNLSLIHI